MSTASEHSSKIQKIFSPNGSNGLLLEVKRREELVVRFDGVLAGRPQLTMSRASSETAWVENTFLSF
jgi:hypothetical protein